MCSEFGRISSARPIHDLSLWRFKKKDGYPNCSATPPNSTPCHDYLFYIFFCWKPYNLQHVTPLNSSTWFLNSFHKIKYFGGEIMSLVLICVSYHAELDIFPMLGRLPRWRVRKKGQINFGRKPISKIYTLTRNSQYIWPFCHTYIYQRSTGSSIRAKRITISPMGLRLYRHFDTL